MEHIKHDLRLSETVSPFGVGSIVDVRGESLIAPDTSWWDLKHSQEIHCARLLASLGGGTLRQAPTHSSRAGKDTASLLYWRFPAWRFCEQCQRLSQLSSRVKGKWSNTCRSCQGRLVPMRFVAVCKGGSHVQDIEWFKWAHRGHDDGVTEKVRLCRAYDELTFVRAADRGEGLGSLSVHCGGCNRTRKLSALIGEGALKRDGFSCFGAQPWQDRADVQPCPHELIAVPRGRTGNCIAETVAALDIPEAAPMSARRAERIRAHSLFEKVVADNGGPQSEMVAEWIAEELQAEGVSVEEILELALSQAKGGNDESIVRDLKDGEWAAFLDKIRRGGRDEADGDFVVDAWSMKDSEAPEALSRVISDVGQVRRVREVMALSGFRRWSAESTLVPADMSKSAGRPQVFPAIETYGEGIFLRFDEDALSEWENQASVQARARILIERREREEWAHRLEVPEARYIALHTLAHALIRRMAHASGYTSAALKERIYANRDGEDRTAGILIYTSAGDSQGTLGGLVRLGSPTRLVPLLIAALSDADFCSNDPVCIESDRGDSGSLNLAACHGCSLISETSCESANRLLDRQLVIGRPGGGLPGLLEGVLNEVRTGEAIR